MFNALNRYLSRLDGDSRQQQNEGQGYGFQVLRNTNLELGVEPWFDFIVGINGRMIVRSKPYLILLPGGILDSNSNGSLA